MLRCILISPPLSLQGMLEGVTSRTKALIKMKDVYYKYPSREINTLNEISVQVSMASRVAVIGVNGAGKSTLIKLMVGEIEPNEGEGVPTIVRHPNMRLAYVAQHGECPPRCYIYMNI